jgi:protein TonB
MSSTAEAGTYAAPTGNTLYGKPPAVAEPGEAKPYRSDAPATTAEVSSLPEPIQVELPRSEYPPQALRAGIEGAVKLRLVVDEQGSVREATVVSDPGYGLGPAAARAAKRWFRFRPARKDGAPVAVEIPFTVRFVLQ